MAVGINNALFQTGQNHINRKAKKDKALQKDNVQTRGSKQVSGKQNYSKSGEVSDNAVSTYADITTKNGIGISVKSDNGIANTYKTKDDGVMLQLSDDSDIEIEDDSVSGDKSSQKTKKEEEYEKFQKQLENLKDMLERMKEAQKNAAKTETKTKKVLNYSYKKVSSSIQGAKSISQASNAVASANSNLSALRRKAASGNYDADELNIAISHAKRMITIAKKKLAHIKQEVMNRKDDDKYISSKKETVVKIPDEKIRAEQQKELRKIEDEIRKQEKREKQAHRGEENSKLMDADITYLKEKIEIWKRGGGDFGIMMSQAQGASLSMDMSQTLVDTSKLATEQIELSAGESPEGQTEIAASINLSV